jgi:hypothetical protein
MVQAWPRSVPENVGLAFLTVHAIIPVPVLAASGRVRRKRCTFRPGASQTAPAGSIGANGPPAAFVDVQSLNEDY